MQDDAAQPAWRRTQLGLAILVPIVVGEGIALVALGLSGLFWVMVPVVLITGLVLALFHRLTVTVTLDHVEARFGIGLIRRRVPVEQITAVRRIRTSLLDGWGIRMQRQGWLWNVSGFDAVQMDLASGRTWAIGTDRPDEAVAAIAAVAGLPDEPAGD